MTSLRAAAKGGRIVTCGATSGPNPKEEIRLIFWKQLSILGSTMANDREFRALYAAVAAGRLRPRVDRVFPFSEAARGVRAGWNRASSTARSCSCRTAQLPTVPTGTEPERRRRGKRQRRNSQSSSDASSESSRQVTIGNARVQPSRRTTMSPGSRPK